MGISANVWCQIVIHFHGSSICDIGKLDGEKRIALWVGLSSDWVIHVFRDEPCMLN